MPHQYRSGSVKQSGMKSQPSDYGHEFITAPVIGIVLQVYLADDPINQSANLINEQRGSRCEARVLVVDDGFDSPWILPNVVIPPAGNSGYDNFFEELPLGVSGTVSGKIFKTGLQGVPYAELDGDYCVVDFIGGSVNSPFISHWWPHPANKIDPGTSNADNTGVLRQGRRLMRRFQGTRLGVTSKGTVMLDTSEANHPKLDGKRTPDEKGGDINITVKESRTAEINFNPSVYNPEEQDFLWETLVEKAREEALTRIIADKDFIRLLAGRVVEVAGSEKVYLGKEGATENLVLGQQLKSLLIAILNALIAHNHPTGTGPSGPPINAAAFSNALSSVQAEDQLSTWLFGQKDPPPWP